MLWLHGVYSSYKYYGNSLRRLLDEKWVRQASIAMAAAGQVALSAGYFGYVTREVGDPMRCARRASCGPRAMCPVRFHPFCLCVH